MKNYKKVIAMVDDALNLVEIVEEHPCPNGSEWVIYQYKRTSPLILSAWREGHSVGWSDFSIVHA